MPICRTALALAALACLAACADAPAPLPAPAPPAGTNVVLVVADALRAANLPMYGYPRPTAPRLAALARDAILFENHLVHFPGTTVSVSQMLTGRIAAPLFVGYDYLAVPMHAEPARLLVLPRALRAAGFHTGIVSAHYWFGGSADLLREFDAHAIVSQPSGDKPYATFDRLLPEIDAFLDAAAAAGRPFFLYVHAMDTHGPNGFHRGFDRFRNAADWPDAYNRYDAEIEYTDHGIGQVLDSLQRRGLLERTVFAVTADHGEDFGEMGPERWNANHGLLVRRSQLHVPWLLRLPGAAGAGRRFRGLTGHVDVAPTLLRLALPDADVGAFDVDGLDLAAPLRAGAADHAEERLLFAFSGRFRGIYTAGHEVHFDTWEGTRTPLLRVVPDARNYPRLEPDGDEVLRGRLVAALEEQRAHHAARVAALPLRPIGAMPDRFGLSIMMDLDPASEARPTFADDAGDGRWYLPGPYLRVAAGEAPPPLQLATDFVPGSYRVTLVLDHSGIEGYAHEFTIDFPGSGPGTATRVEGHGDIARRRVDLGVHELGNPLRVRIREPRGGVSISGLEFERQAGAADAAPLDADAKERLRQLGYE